MSGALKHSSKLSKIIVKGLHPSDSHPFAYPDDTSDITLIISGRNLYVSKLVLSLASPVFKALFQGEYKDKDIMFIPDKNYEDFIELLLCVYPSTNQSITMSKLEAILNLADEYEIHSVKKRCEEMIQSKAEDSATRAEIVHLMYLTDKYNLPQKICVEKMKQRKYSGHDGYKYDPDFDKMSKEAKYSLLSNRIVAFETALQTILKTDCVKSANLIADPMDSSCQKCEKKHGNHTSDVCKSLLNSNMVGLVEKVMELSEIMK